MANFDDVKKTEAEFPTTKQSLDIAGHAVSDLNSDHIDRAGIVTSGLDNIFQAQTEDQPQEQEKQEEPRQEIATQTQNFEQHKNITAPNNNFLLHEEIHDLAEYQDKQDMIAESKEPFAQKGDTNFLATGDIEQLSAFEPAVRDKVQPIDAAISNQNFDNAPKKSFKSKSYSESRLTYKSGEPQIANEQATLTDLQSNDTDSFDIAYVPTSFDDVAGTGTDQSFDMTSSKGSSESFDLQTVTLGALDPKMAGIVAAKGVVLASKNFADAAIATNKNFEAVKASVSVNNLADAAAQGKRMQLAKATGKEFGKALAVGGLKSAGKTALTSVKDTGKMAAGKVFDAAVTASGNEETAIGKTHDAVVKARQAAAAKKNIVEGIKAANKAANWAGKHTIGHIWKHAPKKLQRVVAAMFKSIAKVLGIIGAVCSGVFIVFAIFFVIIIIFILAMFGSFLEPDNEDILSSTSTYISSLDAELLQKVYDIKNNWKTYRYEDGVDYYEDVPTVHVERPADTENNTIIEWDPDVTEVKWDGDHIDEFLVSSVTPETDQYAVMAYLSSISEGDTQGIFEVNDGTKEIIKEIQGKLYSITIKIEGQDEDGQDGRAYNPIMANVTRHVIYYNDDGERVEEDQSGREETGKYYQHYVCHVICNTLYTAEDYIQENLYTSMSEDAQMMYDAYMDGGNVVNLIMDNPLYGKESTEKIIIAQRYGQYFDRETKKIKMNNGLSLMCNGGDKIYAVFDGTVSQDGDELVLEDAVYTVKYEGVVANTSGKVKTGDVIGTANGDTFTLYYFVDNHSKNPQLYFDREIFAESASDFDDTISGSSSGKTGGSAVTPSADVANMQGTTVQKILKIAAQYLGYPYKMGARNPDRTGYIDCSGLVCWTFTHAGALPKGYDTTAQGLYNISKKVSTPKAGDLVFFEGTYDTHDGRVVTHVGIVVDPAKHIMINAGDPVKYANYQSSYFAPKLYVYGRIVEQ